MRDLLERAVCIIEESAAADEHAEWLQEARAFLNPPTYKIISIDSDKAKKDVETLTGEVEAMQRLCILASAYAKTLANKPTVQISGTHEVGVYFGAHRVMSFRAVCASPINQLVQA
jgi:hypothetical protein